MQNKKIRTFNFFLSVLFDDICFFYHADNFSNKQRIDEINDIYNRVIIYLVNFESLLISVFPEQALHVKHNFPLLIS